MVKCLFGVGKWHCKNVYRSIEHASHDIVFGIDSVQFDLKQNSIWASSCDYGIFRPP